MFYLFPPRGLRVCFRLSPVFVRDTFLYGRKTKMAAYAGVRRYFFDAVSRGVLPEHAG